MIPTIGALLVMMLAASGARHAAARSQDCAGAERLVADAVNRGTPEPQALAGVLETYTRALAMCPNHPGALNALGDTLERLGRLEEAIDAYRRAAQARSGWELPMFGLGDAYLKLGRRGEALYWYRKGLELNPTDAETQARVRELAVNDPPGLIGAGSIRDVLDPARGPGVVAQALAFDERVLPFAFGSAELKKEADGQLRELAFALLDVLGAARSLGVLDSAGPPVVEIAGHTDGRGTDAVNMALGLRRAEAVVDVLVREYRIPRGRIVITTFGKSQPVCRDETESCYARNRRVEVRRPRQP